MMTYIILIGLMILIAIVLGRQLWTRHTLKDIGVKSLESFHTQWLGIAVIWLVASAIFGFNYLTKLYTDGTHNTLYLAIAIFYAYVGFVYVVDGMMKDILTKEFILTSKGKISWSDVRDVRFISDAETPHIVYLEVYSTKVTLLMKFRIEDRTKIETIISDKFDV